jgi:fatty acid desaturase
VNYHLEHHLLMTVPHYQLPRLHRLLEENVWRMRVERGGYPAVLRRRPPRRPGGARPCALPWRSLPSQTIVV